MIKKSISIIALLLFVASSTAFAQPKIGYLNMQEVVNEHPQRDSVERQLNEFISEKDQILQERARKYFEEVSEFEENKDSMSSEERQSRQNELARKDQELVEFRDNISSQIQQRQEQLLGPIINEINSEIAEVARERNLEFVLNEKTQVGENIIYFSSQEENDITDEVINRLKK